jgi:hypothetical protein
MEATKDLENNYNDKPFHAFSFAKLSRCAASCGEELVDSYKVRHTLKYVRCNLQRILVVDSLSTRLHCIEIESEPHN